MKPTRSAQTGPNTIVALALIPLSGFAMDIYIPSLPDMALQLHTTPAAIQLTLSLFIISYGIAQLIVGGLIDSYGRHRPAMLSMLIFSAASFMIAFSDNIQVIYALRVLQGITVAVIVVSKRAFFVDVYSGDQLKKYTSLFSVIWAIAPIVAPFLGGFFQTTWGWASNFIFLGFFSLAFFFIEAGIGRESMKSAQPFQLRSFLGAYGNMLHTKDFTSGILILGLCYGMILLYGMCSPFLIEHRLQFSPVVTGYCALFSGVAVLIGGTVSRMLVKKPWNQKLVIAAGLQLVTVAIMIPLTMYYQNLFTLLVYVFLLHSTGGFIFNNLMSYCLIRFPQYAGKASGLAGGGFAVVTSVFSSFLVNTISITSQAMLGVAYAALAIIIFALITKTAWKGDDEKKDKQKPQSQPSSALAIAVAEA